MHMNSIFSGNHKIYISILNQIGNQIKLNQIKMNWTELNKIAENG